MHTDPALAYLTVMAHRNLRPGTIRQRRCLLERLAVHTAKLAIGDPIISETAERLESLYLRTRLLTPAQRRTLLAAWNQTGWPAAGLKLTDPVGWDDDTIGAVEAALDVITGQ